MVLLLCCFWGFFAMLKAVKFAEQRLAEDKPQVLKVLQHRGRERADFPTPCPAEAARIDLYLNYLTAYFNF